MSKVLFAGTYREKSGWGSAARAYIQAMIEANIDLCIRPVRYSNDVVDLPDEFLYRENRETTDCDVIIQNCLPNDMEWQGRFKKNIGLFFTETQLDYDHPWISKIKLMDELWLPTVDMDYLTFDNINSYIVPVPTDPKKYDNVNPLDLSMLGDTYKFYYIGEYHRRKNISGLVQAFYLQFTRNEPVSLILKCNKPGVDPETLMHEINDMCRKVADALKLYPRFEDYPTIAIITKYISDEEILGLHKTCDCYVNPSFAEGWCVPLSDAFGVGNQVVSNGVGCALDFTEARLTDDAFMVLSHREPVLGMNESASYLYTGREIWKRPNVLLMSDLMGIRYSHDKRDKKPLLPFTTEKVGLMIKERIDDPN